MSLQKQLVPLVFEGLDSHSDPKTVKATALLKLENAVVVKPSEIRKREGYTALSSSMRSGGGLSGVLQLAKCGDTMVALSGGSSNAAAQYASAANVWDALATGLQIPVTMKRTPLQIPGTLSRCNTEIAVGQGGKKALVAVSGGSAAALSACYALMDLSTGEQTWTTLTGDTHAHAYAVGKWLCLTSVTVGTATLKIRLWDSTTAMASPTVFTVSAQVDTSVGPVHDVQVSNGYLVIAYRKVVGGVVTLEVAAYDPNTNSVYASGSFAGVTADCVGWLTRDEEGAYTLAYYDATTGLNAVRMALAPGSLLSTTYLVDATYAPGVHGNVQQITGFEEGGSVAVLYTQGSATAATSRSALKTTHATFVPGGAVTLTHLYGAQLKSKPRSVGGIWLLWVTDTIQDAEYRNTNQLNTHDFCLVVGTDGLKRIPQSMFLVGSSQGPWNDWCWLTHIDGDGTDLLVGAAEVIAASDAPVYVVQSVAPILGRMVYASMPVNVVSSERTAYIPGGTLRMVDGARYVGHPLPQSPWGLTGAGAAAGGGALAAGTEYWWRACFRWVDAHGQLWRSAPSEILKVTPGAGQNAADITVPTLQLADFASEVQIEIYRTTSDSDVFRLVRVVDNNPTVNTVTWRDTGAATGEILYTVSGELENCPPPSSVAAAVYQGRLWLACGDTLWYSKEMVAGFGPGFHPALTIRIPGDDITALSVCDDKLVIFKERGIWALAGDGPNALGQGSYPTPQMVAPAYGTTYPRSVAMSPDGVVFWHAGNPWLMSRGMDVQFLGAPVDGLLAAPADTIVVPGSHQVRIYGSGQALVYDWVHKLWSQWKSTAWAKAALSCAGSVYVCGASGFVIYADVPGLYLDGALTEPDGGVPIVTRVTLANLSLAGIRGAQRIYRVQLLGEWSGTAAPVTQALTAKLYYDHSLTAGETHTFAPAAAMQSIELRPSQQKCSSISIELYDAPVTGAPVFKLSAAMLEVGTKAGVGRIPSSRRFT